MLPMRIGQISRDPQRCSTRLSQSPATYTPFAIVADLTPLNRWSRADAYTSKVMLARKGTRPPDVREMREVLRDDASLTSAPGEG